MEPLQWTTVQRRVNDLLPLDINPRKITEEKRQKLIQSIERFNLADIPVINADDAIISGHQRMKALQFLGRGDQMIDVRIPNRLLSDKEVREYMLIANTHSGEFDTDLLDEFFNDIDFEGLGIDLPGTVDVDAMIAAAKEIEPSGYDTTPQWFLNVRCNDEKHCQELYEKFIAEGMDVKIVT